MPINTTNNITLTNLPLIAMFEWQIFSHVSTPPLSQCLSICLSPTNKRSNLRGSWRGSALGLGQHGNHIFNLSIYLTSILYSVKTKTICSDTMMTAGAREPAAAAACWAANQIRSIIWFSLFSHGAFCEELVSAPVAMANGCPLELSSVEST